MGALRNNHDQDLYDLARGDVTKATAHRAHRQQQIWSHRATSWQERGSKGLERVIEELLDEVGVRGGDRILDLGCGNGQLTLPLAERGAEVLAVDVSQAMIESLRAEMGRRGVHGIQAATRPIESIRLPPRSFDVVVSSYALHHLRDRDKSALAKRAFEWLPPGGRLVVADMMFGRGGSAADRAIFLEKVRAMAKKGPAGWWRILKGAFHVTFRVTERPLPIAAWEHLLEGAGFDVVLSRRIVGDAAIVIGERPKVPDRVLAGRR